MGLIGCVVFKIHAQQIQLITPKLIDFGKIQEASPVQGEILFLNSGSETLNINRIRTSCGCTATEIEKNVYAPGDTARIKFSIDTRGFRNVTRKAITIFFEEKAVQNLKYTIQMNVFSDVELSPRYISFRHVQLNPDTIITDYFAIQNNSEKPLTIMKVTSNYDLIQVFPQSVKIPPKKEHLFRVELRPVRKEQKSVSVYIETNHQHKKNILQPLFVQIEG
jgi:hypothetical protein